MSFKINIF